MVLVTTTDLSQESVYSLFAISNLPWSSGGGAPSGATIIAQDVSSYNITASNIDNYIACNDYKIGVYDASNNELYSVGSLNWGGQISIGWVKATYPTATTIKPMGSGSGNLTIYTHPNYGYVTSLGSKVSAGLPNITGNFGEFMYSGTDNTSAPFTYTADSTAKMGGTTAKNKGYVTMNLHNANSIYGSSNTVTPISLKTSFYIRY